MATEKSNKDRAFSDETPKGSILDAKNQENANEGVKDAGNSQKTSSKERVGKKVKGIFGGTKLYEQPAQKKNDISVSNDVSASNPYRLTLSVNRVSPASVAKNVFLLSVAVSIFFLVAVLLIWLGLNFTGVLAKLNNTLSSAGLSQGTFNIGQYFGLGQVMSFAVILSVFNIIGFTLCSTILAAVYNIVTRLVGGIRITLGDD